MTTVTNNLVKVEQLLDRLESVRNWVHAASSTTEIEAVERTIGCNAPIGEINDAIDLVWSLYGQEPETSETTKMKQFIETIARMQPCSIDDTDDNLESTVAAMNRLITDARKLLYP